jgi:hypothetical protein
MSTNHEEGRTISSRTKARLILTENMVVGFRMLQTDVNMLDASVARMCQVESKLAHGSTRSDALLEEKRLLLIARDVLFLSSLSRLKLMASSCTCQGAYNLFLQYSVESFPDIVRALTHHWGSGIGAVGYSRQFDWTANVVEILNREASARSHLSVGEVFDWEEPWPLSSVFKDWRDVDVFVAGLVISVNRMLSGRYDTASVLLDKAESARFIAEIRDQGRLEGDVRAGELKNVPRASREGHDARIFFRVVFSRISEIVG